MPFSSSPPEEGGHARGLAVGLVKTRGKAPKMLEVKFRVV